MGVFGRWWEGSVLPRVVDHCCGADELVEARARVAGGLRGEVVEIGFGTGLNVPHLPATVTRLHAVEPQADAAGRLGAERISASAVPISFVGLDGQDLPLPDASIDAALCTFSLCSIPDASRALGELRRVVKPEGTFHFLEHGLAPDAAVARWQHRLTPVQRLVFGGCHLDRPIADLVTGAGFVLTELTTGYVLSPKPLGFVYEGVATNPAA